MSDDGSGWIFGGFFGLANLLALILDGDLVNPPTRKGMGKGLGGMVISVEGGGSRSDAGASTSGRFGEGGGVS